MVKISVAVFKIRPDNCFNRTQILNVVLNYSRFVNILIKMYQTILDSQYWSSKRCRIKNCKLSFGKGRSSPHPHGGDFGTLEVKLHKSPENW